MGTIVNASFRDVEDTEVRFSNSGLIREMRKQFWVGYIFTHNAKGKTVDINSFDRLTLEDALREGKRKLNACYNTRIGNIEVRYADNTTKTIDGVEDNLEIHQWRNNAR